MAWCKLACCGATCKSNLQTGIAVQALNSHLALLPLLLYGSSFLTLNIVAPHLQALNDHHALLEGTLLKPNMVLAGGC